MCEKLCNFRKDAQDVHKLSPEMKEMRKLLIERTENETPIHPTGSLSVEVHAIRMDWLQRYSETS